MLFVYTGGTTIDHLKGQRSGRLVGNRYTRGPMTTRLEKKFLGVLASFALYVEYKPRFPDSE